MATLADLFASTQAPNVNQLRAQPVAYQRGGSKLGKAVGTVGDILAAIGGRAPVYEGTMQARENAYNQSMEKQQFQNVFRNFVENPNDPMVQANLAEVNPDAFLKVAPQNKVVGDRVINMSPLGGTPKVLVDSPDEVLSPKDAALKRIESGAYTPEQLPLLRQIAGIGPRGSDFQIVETPRGYEQVNRVTGETKPLGIAAPPRASSGGDGGSKASDFQILQDESGNFIRANKLTGEITPLGGVRGSGARLTQDESKTTGYLSRATEANKVLSDPKTINPGIGARAARELPLGAGSLITREAEAKALNARDAFLTAVLRKESGATITGEERSTYGKIYFPEPGDTKATIQQKAKMRETAIGALKVGAGRGARQAGASASGPTATGPNGQKIMWNGTAWVPAR